MAAGRYGAGQAVNGRERGAGEQRRTCGEETADASEHARFNGFSVGGGRSCESLEGGVECEFAGVKVQCDVECVHFRISEEIRGEER